MNDPDPTLETLVFEAVKVCGSDLEAIERHVARQLDARDPQERERIHRDVRRLLSFHPPGFPKNRPH